MDETLIDLEPVKRLSKDLAAAARLLTKDEARFLVDAYYIIQDDRKRADSQVKALTDKPAEKVEPTGVLAWYSDQSSILEKQIARALDQYSAASELGQWARSIVGIGPVIAAGLLAHIDIEKANTAGHIWRFAGLDPSQKWDKGQKRPWNADLKVLCWKIGESFVKVSGNDEAFYGAVYVKRKAFETARNEAGYNAETAAVILTQKKFKKSTEAYKHLTGGKLPPAHIHSRAKRYAVKLFLSHYHAVGFKLLHGIDPPLPYPITHLGHVDFIRPPNT